MSDQGSTGVLRTSKSSQSSSYISMDDSITTNSDPDHKSYTRHFESSQSARKSLPKEYNRSLAELSSTLSASSSLSGSTQYPRDDDDDDEDENDDNNTNDVNDSDSISVSSLAPPTGIRGSAHLNSFPPSTQHSSTPTDTSSLSETHLSSNSNPPLTGPAATSNSLSSSSLLNHNMSRPANHTTHNRQRNPSRFKHYHKPKVTESPRLVYLCQKFINEGNLDGLALIARRRGLPPKLRQYAWPLLLASHPYVVNPSVVTEYPTQPLSNEQVPLKRIKNEIARYQKRLAMATNPKSRTTATSSTSASVASNVTQNGPQNLQQPSLYQSTRLTPASTSPTGSSWSEPSNSKPNPQLPELAQGESITTASLGAQKQEAIEEAIKSFLTKWGRIIPYESGMVYMAFSLAESVDPICRMEDRHNHLKDTQASGTTESQASSPELSPADGNPAFSKNDQQKGTSSGPSSFSASLNSSPVSSGNATPTLGAQAAPVSLSSLSFQLPYVFAEVFEHFMLVCFHSVQDGLNGPRGPCDSPTTDRISFFLSVIRRLLPDLAKHFDEEDVLSSIGGDEWLLWWVKWMGAKVWDRRDRARIWDMYLGWRPYPASPEFDFQNDVAKKIRQQAALVVASGEIPNEPVPIPSASISTVPGSSQLPSSISLQDDEDPSNKTTSSVLLDLVQLEMDLGPDPFWSATISDDNDIKASKNNENADDSAISSHFLPQAPSTSNSEPLLEHLFVCLVLLKSKTATLLELDQSEIRGCLGKLYRSKDIESIIVEAGECWRTWKHAEDLDDTD